MKTNQFPIRLHEARLMMGFSMEKLAELTGDIITKQSISRYEKGIMCPKRDALAALAKALNISEDYFNGNSISIDMPALRTTAQGKLTNDELADMEARLSFWAEQYTAKEEKAGFTACFEHPLQGFRVSTQSEAIEAASMLREQWHCGDGPIASILRLLERKGIRILSTPLPNGVLGLSTWANGKYPIIVIDLTSKSNSVERLRFTAAHELAHLLLDLSAESELSVEKRCDLFASAFLLPPQTYIEEMDNTPRESITLGELIDLKEIYGLSVAALLIGARYYHIISAERKRQLYDEYITPNVREEGMGHYAFPETLGREKRIDSIIIDY